MWRASMLAGTGLRERVFPLLFGVALCCLSSALAMAQDAYEEDDACIPSKTVIYGGDTQSHNFYDDDADWLKFNACTGRSYTIDAVPVGSLADIALELYDADCASPLASKYGGAPGTPASIVWAAPADGTYHIKVLQFDATFGDNREYDVTLTGDTSFCSAWARTYGGTGTDQAYSIQQTSDGGYVVAGHTTSFGPGNYDFWVLKLNPSGGVQYENSFGNANTDYAYSVQQTSDGGYIVAGGTHLGIGINYEVWVLKLNSDLTINWENTYGGISNELANSIQQTADGGYVVAGFDQSSGAGANDFWVLKLDANGGLDPPGWENTYGDTSSERANSIQQTADGGYVVAGYTSSFGAGSSDFWVLKLDADGNVGPAYPGTWENAYGGANYEEATSVQQTADGGYVVAGNTNFDDVWVLKLNSDGTIDWENTYGGVIAEEANSIQQTSDGGYVVAGWTESFGAGNYDVWVLKLNSDGTIDWEKTYGGASFVDSAQSIQQTSDGGYVVAGYTYSFGEGSADFWVLKLRENGDIHFPACMLTADTAADVGGVSPGVDGSAAAVDSTGVIPGGTGAVDFLSAAVFDEQCASACSTFSVSCSASVLPAAVVCIGTQQNFTGSSSGSGEGALSYAWDFDYDGVTFDVMATGTTASYTYLSAGDFTAAFRVADSCADPAPQECISTIPITIHATVNVIYDAGFTPLLAQVCGDGDAIVEPGEEWDVTVQLLNDTPCAPGAKNVEADLTVNAGSAVAATVSGNPGSYGDMLPGATASFTYSFVVDSAAACSNYITFDVTNIVSDEGPYPDQIPAFDVWVGIMLFSEDFEDAALCTAFPPADWEELEGGFNTNGWEHRGPDCPSGCPSGYPLPTNFAINDSKCEGFGSWQDTELITPLIDASAATKVELRFDHDFQGYFEGMFDDSAYVKARSTNKTGGAWDTLIQWFEWDSVSGTVVLDATDQCAGEPDCQFEWLYQGYDDLYWAIDNVVVSAALPCEMSGAIITPDGPTAFCAGGSVDLAASWAGGGVPPLTYQWYESGNPIVPPETNSTYTATAAGTYSVEITDGNGCVDMSADEVVTVDAWVPADLVYDTSFTPTLTKVCGDGDLVVEPGERWSVTVQLVNNAVTCTANNVKADLTVNAGSAVAATVCLNPGLYGTMPGGATAQFTYQFEVDPAAVCVNDITFDVTGISSNEGPGTDETPAFTVQVGQTTGGAIETGTQFTDPLNATGGSQVSDFAPAFTLVQPVASASLDWTSLTCLGGGAQTIYSDPCDDLTGWTVTGTVDVNNQSPDPCLGGGVNNFRAKNSAAIERVIDTTGYVNIVVRTDWHKKGFDDGGECVILQYSTGGPWVPWFQSCGTAPDDTWQCNENAPMPQAADNNPLFAIRFESTAVAGGGNDFMRLDQIIVEGDATCTVTANTKVELVGPPPANNAITIKDYTEADPPKPIDVTAFYNGAGNGPGTYQIQLSENAGGTATLTGGVLDVTGLPTTECDASACGCPALPPPEPSPPGALDPLIIPTAANQIIVENVADETGYVVYENAIGTWYGTPSQGCMSGGDVVDLGVTVQLNYPIVTPGDRWVVVSAANAAGESSCGTDSDTTERNTAPGWPATGPCP